MCFGPKETDESKRSKAIDKSIDTDKKTQSSNVKLLLLGIILLSFGEFTM